MGDGREFWGKERGRHDAAPFHPTRLAGFYFICRIVLLLYISVTYRLFQSVVMPKGSEKLAAEPVPSVEPFRPEPAMVVTSFVDITILRIV